MQPQFDMGSLAAAPRQASPRRKRSDGVGRLLYRRERFGNSNTLDIAVAYDAPWSLGPDATDAYKRYTKIVFDSDYPGDQIRKFKAQMKHGEVVTLRNTVCC